MASPAAPISWRMVQSSAVEAVGWDDQRHAFVLYRHRGLYMYGAISRQKVVACATAPSVGRYLNEKVVPNHPAWRIAARPDQLELRVGGGDQDG